ncbi:MAG: hypothetical protein IPH13_09660 [Planctomycetes bacterium]|nr:hypothetical protein [Planctomycetota bacterium]
MGYDLYGMAMLFCKNHSDLGEKGDAALRALDLLEGDITPAEELVRGIRDMPGLKRCAIDTFSDLFLYMYDFNKKLVTTVGEEAWIGLSEKCRAMKKDPFTVPCDERK